MKTIKVTNVQKHTTTQSGEVDVVKGKLILLPCGDGEGADAISAIIISETEQPSYGGGITLDCKVYDSHYKKIVDEPVGMSGYKIIALPENLSVKHRQAIVDGKLRHGDEVFVECIQTNIFMDGEDPEYEVLCNPSTDNHITLHPVKKKENRMLDKLDIYSGDLNTERIKTYKELAKAYSIQEGTVRDIFCKGAEWVIDVSERK